MKKRSGSACCLQIRPWGGETRTRQERKGLVQNSQVAPRGIILNFMCIRSPKHPCGTEIACTLPKWMKQNGAKAMRVLAGWEMKGFMQCDLPAFKYTHVGNGDAFSWMHPVQTMPLSFCQFRDGFMIFVYFLLSFKWSFFFLHYKYIVFLGLTISSLK